MLTGISGLVLRGCQCIGCLVTGRNGRCLTGMDLCESATMSYYFPDNCVTLHGFCKHVQQTGDETKRITVLFRSSHDLITQHFNWSKTDSAGLFRLKSLIIRYGKVFYHITINKNAPVKLMWILNASIISAYTMAFCLQRVFTLVQRNKPTVFRRRVKDYAAALKYVSKPLPTVLPFNDAVVVKANIRSKTEALTAA